MDCTYTAKLFRQSILRPFLVLSQEKRKSGVVTGKDLIELLPIDENLSDVNGNKDPVQHALILPNVRTCLQTYIF